MKVQEAIQNICVVVSNARMTQQEHDTLKQSITLIAQRCQRADELEREIESYTKSKKNPEKKKPKKEDKK